MGESMTNSTTKHTVSTGRTVPDGHSTSARKSVPQWPAPAAILLGLVCILSGFGLLVWTPGAAPAVVGETALDPVQTVARPVSTNTELLTATDTPARLSTTTGPAAVTFPTVLPTATDPPLPTLSLMAATAAPTAITPPTLLPTLTETQPVSLAETGATFTLTIVHTNDTWGYTRPCG
jgi:hypothetical protein